MTTDIYSVSGRSRVAGGGLVRRAIGTAWRSATVRQRLGSVVRGPDPAAGWKGFMDRISFAAMLLLALGLWLHPYVTGGSNSTANPAAVAKTIDGSLAMFSPDRRADALPRPIIRNDNPKIVRGTPGFWRLSQSETGVWWFLTPTDQPEFLNTVTTVQPFQAGRDSNGINYVSKDWTGRGESDGDLDLWAKKTINRVRGMGFKGLGAWSHQVFHKYDIPMTRDLNVTTWVPASGRRFYSHDWASTAEYSIQAQVTPLKNNANLVGYYIDNELDWADKGAGPSYYFDNLPPSDPNRQQVVKVIQSIWPKLEDFNRDWHVGLKDWSDIDNWTLLPHEHAHAYNKLYSGWLYRLAEDYFDLTCRLIRKYDPNHLILGVRFRGHAPREVVRASRDKTDAQSINYYVSDALLDSEMFEMMYEESGQPIMITEYSFHSLDGRSGNRNTVGFAAQVLDQRARADGYRLLTTRAARVPYIIGVDWFQWSDEPPSGRSSDGEDVNFGVVDIDDQPYELLAAAISQTAPLLNGAHADSTSTSQSDVWRETFDTKPVVRVPHLATPINLNGELSEWMSDSRLEGVRHSQSVGLDRSSLPVPNVYMGWNEKGLYLAFEIFDRDIEGAPAKGWWWTRDYVEFWVSTKPVAKDQDTFDVNSHQFFFVPNAWPGEDGAAGTVGQWHRPGDALSDNLIPHPTIRSAARVLPDRYVVEMFIPALALNGFDPQNSTEMAFNLHVRNFQQATDYFWSAPKEVMTQLRPGTWGTMRLETPRDMNLTQAKYTAPKNVH